MLVNHWHILSYFFFTCLFLLICITLTVSNTISAWVFDFRIGRSNPGTFGAALTSCSSGHSWSSMPFLYYTLDSSSAAQLSLLSFGWSKSRFQFTQCSVTAICSCVLSSSLSTGWKFILRIVRTFKIRVLPPGRYLAEKAGGKGDLSDNLNAATTSCWKSDQEALTSSSMSEMYLMPVICLFWVWVSHCVAHRFWLPCHISKKSWTLPILCNLLSSASVFISELYSVFVVCDTGLLARANCLTMTFSQTESPEGFDCFQPITSRPREKLASTPTICDTIENMSHATLERSAYFKCIASCWCYRSVICGIQTVWLISIGSEW